MCVPENVGIFNLKLSISNTLMTELPTYFYLQKLHCAQLNLMNGKIIAA